MPLVAGVDCSTQSTKVVIVDVDDGAIVAGGRADHDVVGEGATSESDPSTWSAALEAALAATGRAGDVAVVSVAGQQHGLVVTDGHGRPLRPAVLWNDTRSAAEAAALVADFGPYWWATTVGSVPVPSFTVTSWAWLRAVESDVADATRRIRLPHDWLTELLCGRGVTDRGDASGTGWWSTPQDRYVDDVLEHPAVAVDPALLPQVLGPCDVAGEVGAAGCFGLRPGTLVGPGTGDNMAGALGLGLAPGEPVLSLGTSGTVYAVAEQPATDPSGVVAGFADATGLYLPLACTLNATVAVDRMASWLGIDRDAVEEASGSVVVVPYLDGERTPNLPNATGTVVGLTHATRPGEILRSTYEGVVVSLLDALARITTDADAPLVLIGGGARGAVWRDVVRSLSGRSVLVPDSEELVALGAAAQAGALVTGESPDAVARRWDTRRGAVLDAVDCDEATLGRHHRVREALADLGV